MTSSGAPRKGRRAAAADNSAAAFPSREDIVAFIERDRAAAAKEGDSVPPIVKRDIARAFNIKGGADRITLKRILKEIEADLRVSTPDDRSGDNPAWPSVLVCDVTGRDRDGDLQARPAEWDAERGPAPTFHVEVPRRPRPGEPIPGIGDRILLKTGSATDGIVSGRVIRILPKAEATILGIYRAAEDGPARLVPIDKKNVAREFLIPESGRNGAEDGDLVAVEIGRARAGLGVAIVRKRLGSLKSEKALSLIAIHARGIPHVFPPDALAEAALARPAALSADGIAREDWRDVPLVTIDPRDAKDHDDAVHAVPDSDPANPGGFVVTVAIADVAAYVRPGSALDREALERGNSVYFPDRVVPMLPERISNDLCSLRPHEDRPALAIRLVLDASGRKKRHSVHRILMRSAAKLAYEQAQAAIDGRPDDITQPLLDDVLRPLWAAYTTAKIARDQRGPLDLDLPERRLALAADGTVDRVVTPERLEAHRLIEEFMILANVAATESLEEKRQMLVYRAHDAPSAEKLTALTEFLASLDIRFAKGQVLRPSQFNGVLSQVRGSAHEHLVNEVVLRSQAQAEYTADNYGHFGLNLRRYAHFTSPIRRYADLVVHRALIRALHLGPDGLPDMRVAELADVATRISAAERRAMAAERDTTDRLIATWLADRIGAVFAGRISGVTRAGLFVKLAETGADGFVPARTIGDEFFRFDEAKRAMIGSHSGDTYRLGDTVDVRLVEAAPFAGALRFELVSDAASRTPRHARGSKGSKKGGPTTIYKAKLRAKGKSARAARKAGKR